MPGEIIKEVQITRVGLEGQGVAYDDEGNIYFVPGAIPGDLVRVRSEDAHKRYRDAEIVELVSPSAERQPSPCAYFPRCGGCDWMHWSYEGQLRGKDAILQHVLERAGWTVERYLPMVGAVHPLGYRNRIQLRQEGKRLGFLKKRSQEIVDLERCEVAHPRLNLEITRLRGLIPQDAAGTASRKKIELSLDESGTVERLDDRPHSFGGFRQINTAQNQRLREKVAAHLKSRGARVVLELFAGDGNLTHAFLPDVERVIAVDLNARALEAARRSKRAEDEHKVIFLEAVVDRRLLKRMPEDFRSSYDTLILDPPRQGAGVDLGLFVHPRLQTIVYVSCSPVTFSQDVSSLKDEFRLEEIQAVDMFPYTRHIEFVALFTRR